MERLAASPYVANVYVSCGTAQVLDYANAGNLHDVIKTARKMRTDNMSSLNKLKICYQVATGLADIQDVLGVSHNDICCHQYIHVDGVYMLNDFHQAKYMKTNTTSKEFCPTESVYNDEVSFLLSFLTPSLSFHSVLTNAHCNF